MTNAQLRTSIYGRRLNWEAEAKAWGRWAIWWFVMLLLSNLMWAVLWITRGIAP